MHRLILKGLFLGGLALILPACDSSDSDDPVAVAAPPIPSPIPSPTPADPEIETFPNEGGIHVPAGTIVAYGTDPPTSGNHYPDPQEGGYFETQIAAGYLVHSMEHGGVIIYYNPVTVTVGQKNHLRELAEDHPGSFAQVICVPRNDPVYPVILTAWTHRLRLTAYDRDAIDGFVTLYLDQGPEHAPEGP